MRYIRKIMILILTCFICAVTIHGYATEKAESGRDVLDKEEKELIEAALKPFEPKLLWEKKFEEQISHVDLAKESGDVIVSTIAPNKNLPSTIYFFDKNGKVLWKQGHIEKIHQPFNAQISDDGESITYDMIDWDTYFTVVFYVDRNNKEKWHKAVPGASHLSPDGSWVVVAPSGGTGSAIVILDSKGEVVLKKQYYWSGGATVRFSEGSRYVATMEYTTVYDKNIYWVFNRNGNIVLEFKREYGDGINSFASNGFFSVAGMLPVSIRNLKGDKILSGDDVIISGDGSVAIKRTKNKAVIKFEIIEIPASKINKSYSLQFSDSFREIKKISHKGRYIVLNSGISSSKKVIILDTVKNAFSKFRLVIPPEDVVRELSPNFPWSQGLFFSKDEKYMLVHVIDEKAVHTIKYYKLP